MNKIKFSHEYSKLFNIDPSEPVTLVQVFPSNTTHLPDEFLHYDTLYFENGKPLNYPLKEGIPCLVLLFAQDGNLFSTICRSTPGKDTYYMTAIGSDFQIEYTKEVMDKWNEI